jgi:hypothetical protein
MDQVDQTNNTKYICVYGEDALGNKSTLASANDINVDITNPTVTFTNDVEAGPVTSDTIRITVTETNPNIATYEYGFSDNAVCDGTDTYGNAFTSGDDFTINAETNNGKWICAIATDTAGNTTYQASANVLNVDITVPAINSITSTTIDGDYNAGDTINITVTFSENVTLAGGNLNVTLDTGDVVAIAPFANSLTASGTYTVGAGDNSADLDSTNIALSAGTLRDAAGNNAAVALPATTIADGSVIVVDTTAPTATIASPSDGDYKSGAFTISGTSSDGTGSGIAGVEVLIQRDSDDKYWDGDSWEVGESWRGATMVGTDWSYNFTANLGDITYFIDARATDNAGNTTAELDQDGIDVLGDVSDPTSAITSPADGAFLSTLSSITGTASDSRSGVANVQITIQRAIDSNYWNGTAWQGGAQPLATTYATGNWTKDSELPVWVSGENYTITSTAWDSVNNNQGAPDVNTFKFDNTAPTVVLSDDHADAIVRDADAVIITATFTEADQLNGTPRITINSPVPLVDNIAMTATADPLVWTYSWNVPAGNDGDHTVSISAQDRAGNANATATGKTSYTLDNTNPATSITDPTAGQYKKGTFTISANATDTSGSGILKVEFYEGANKLGEDSDATGGYTYDWATDASNDGAHALTTVAIDVAGNSVISSTVNITVDNTDPTSVVITDPTAGQYKKGTVTIAATAADAIGVQKVEFYDGDPGAGGTLLGTDTTSAYSYAWVTSAANNGAHTLYAKVYDNADNTLVSAGVGIVVDNTAPTKPTYNSSEGADVWHGSNPTLDIDFADNIKIDTIEYKVNAGGAYRTIATGVDAATYTADWSMDNADWTAMSEGTNYLYFRVTDYANNQYTTENDLDEPVDDTAAFRFKKDVTDPTAPTYATAENQWFVTNPTLDINFSDARAIQTVEYQLDGNGGAWTTLAGSLISTTYTTDWNIDAGIWSGLSEGQHEIYFRVTDDAGNDYITPDQAAAFTFKKDTVAPTVIANLTSSHTENAWSADNTIDFNWDDSTDAGSGLAGYSYVIDHVADTTPDGTVENATSAYTTAALADGSDWYFHVKAIDSLGTATAVTHKGPFKIDRTDPNISHSTVSSETAGVDIHISADVTDTGGSGVGEVRVYYKYHGESSFTDQTMSCDGSWHCTYDIPDEENSDYDVKYYIRALDVVNNDAFDGTSGSPHTVDVTPASVTHFVFTYPTSGTRYAGTWFTTVIEARDQFDNVATGFNGSGDKVSFTTDEGGVSVFVQATGTNQSGAFDKGIWADKIQFGGGGAITPSGSNIVLTASDTDDAGRNGSVTMTTSGATFGTTMVAGVENDGSGGGDGSVQGDEAPAGDEGTLGEGANKNVVVVPVGDTPWYKSLPAEIIAILILIGSTIWWWIRRRGSSGGAGNLGSFMFTTLKTAAKSVRMFLW